MDKATVAKLANQIATRANSPNFSASFGALPNPDPVLKAMGKDISVYRDLRSDAQIGGNIRRRKGAVKSLEWSIEIDSEKSNSQTALTNNIKDIFASLPINKIISEILDATLYGYQPLEVQWAKVGNLIIPTEIVGKPPEWFSFDFENRLRLKSKTDTNGELLPERKFLLARQEPSFDNPYGVPDLAMCFWPTTFKKGGLKFWVTFAEKYGSPWVIGKLPRTNLKEDYDELSEQLVAMIQDAVAVLPDDSSVEIKGAVDKASSAEVYERLLMFCRSEVNYALLGQNQTSEATSNKASATAGLEVTKDIRNSDKALVEEVFNTLIRWIVEINFNADGQLPQFNMWEQEEVDKIMAERDEKLTQAGAKFTNSYFKRAYGLQEGDLSEPENIDKTAKKTAEFAEKDSQNPINNLPVGLLAVDKAINELPSARLDSEIDGLISPIVSAINTADSWEAMEAQLVAGVENQSSDKLAKGLENASFASAMLGKNSE